MVAALALGWGVAAAIHLAFGSPAGRPTVPQVEASLEELGVPAEGVALESHQPQGATRLAAEARLLLAGFLMEHYNISRDDARVAFVSINDEGRSEIWIAALDGSSAPRRLTLCTAVLPASASRS